MTEGPILLDKVLRKFIKFYKIWSIMPHFHCAYHPQSCGLMERTNGTTTQLVKITNAYFLPWPKALLLVSSTSDPLLLTNIICLPLRLLQGDQWDWMKGYMILYYLREMCYCKDLIKLLTSHPKVVSESYHSNLSLNEDQMSHILHSGDYVY